MLVALTPFTAASSDRDLGLKKSPTAMCVCVIRHWNVIFGLLSTWCGDDVSTHAHGAIQLRKPMNACDCTVLRCDPIEGYLLCVRACTDHSRHAFVVSRLW